MARVNIESLGLRSTLDYTLTLNHTGGTPKAGLSSYRRQVINQLKRLGDMCDGPNVFTSYRNIFEALFDLEKVHGQVPTEAFASCLASFLDEINDHTPVDRHQESAIDTVALNLRHVLALQLASN